VASGLIRAHARGRVMRGRWTSTASHSAPLYVKIKLVDTSSPAGGGTPARDIKKDAIETEWV